MLISLASMAAALEIKVVEEYDYPIRTDRPAPSFDTIVTELSRGAAKEMDWQGGSAGELPHH